MALILKAGGLCRGFVPDVPGTIITQGSRGDRLRTKTKANIGVTTTLVQLSARYTVDV